MARDTSTSEQREQLMEFIASLGRIEVRVPLARVRRVFEPYERRGVMFQNFTIRAEGKDEPFSLGCQLEGAERVAAATSVLGEGSLITIRGTLDMAKRKGADGKYDGEPHPRLIVADVGAAA